MISAEPLRDTTLRIRQIHQGSAFTERSAVLGRVPGAPGTAIFYGQWLQAPDDDLTVAAGNWRAVIEASTGALKARPAATRICAPSESARIPVRTH